MALLVSAGILMTLGIWLFIAWAFSLPTQKIFSQDEKIELLSDVNDIKNRAVVAEHAYEHILAVQRLRELEPILKNFDQRISNLPNINDDNVDDFWFFLPDAHLKLFLSGP